MTSSGLEPITRRQRAHLATIEEVKEVARRRLVAEGLSALSLRAVARDMGLVPSALYRYFPSHAHLLSALAADAADSLVDAVTEAQERPPAHEYRARWESAMRGYRSWVIGNDSGYRLNFGDSAAQQLPDIGTQDVLPRLVGILGRNLTAALEAGRLGTEMQHEAVARMELPHPAQAHVDVGVTEEMYIVTLAAWCSMHGLMAMEISGRLQSMSVPADEMFETHLALVTASMGFTD